MTDDLRRRVLDASIALIDGEGLAALSMREVARRAGVSHQAPYHHFGDRAGILAALAEEGFGALADALEAAGPDTSPADELAARGTAYVRFALARPAHFRVMFRPELVDMTRWPGAAAQAARAHRALVSSLLRCVEAGLVAPEELEDCVATTWSTVHGLATLLLEGPLRVKGRTPDALAERVPALLAGLLAVRRRAAE